MWSLPEPRISATTLYDTCTTGLQNVQLSQKLNLPKPLVEGAYATYVKFANAGLLHQFPRSEAIGEVTRHDMSSLYENRLARLGSPGRQAYDLILNGPRNGRCPLCGHRRVSTLDHHLPQSRYAAVALYPLNLVPACKDCNFTKRQTTSATEEQNTLHPYFDNVEEDRWLRATLTEAAPVSFSFHVIPPLSWPVALGNRVRYHFVTFRLGQLYALEAADEMATVQHSIDNLLQAGGAASVRAHLEDEARRLNITRSNWWRTTMYEALAASDWYCNGGLHS
jgi:hypothetical protein